MSSSNKKDSYTNSEKPSHDKDGKYINNYLYYKFGVTPDFWNMIVRPAVFKRYGDKCIVCKSAKFVDAHHLDYNNQTIDTIKPLCRKCHMKEHHG